MYDAHVHLSFMTNGEEVAAAADAAGVGLFCATVTPQEFLSARDRFARFPNVDLGLGLHPWWMESASDADALLELLPQTQFVSEVGLDFGKRHEHTREAQIDAFTRIAQACGMQGGKTLSIHAVHAAPLAIDILEAAGTFESCTCIFHWFTGPSDQLKRAVQAGCKFSVGKRMLATGKGREYARIIPAEQLLLETDAPPEQGQAYSFEELLAALQETEAELRYLRPNAPEHSQAVRR